MKGGQNLRLLKQQREECDEWVKPQPCCICQKMLKGAYGHHGDDWTCSAKCEKTKQSLPRYGEHTEESFLEKLKHDTLIVRVPALSLLP